MKVRNLKISRYEVIPRKMITFPLFPDVLNMSLSEFWIIASIATLRSSLIALGDLQKLANFLDACLK